MQDLAPYFSALSDHAMTLTLAALALGLASVIFLKFRAPWLARIQRKSLLTPNEIEFFHRLERALPAYRVFPQVSFAALLTDDGRLSTQARWSVRARFDRKIADFVVCEGGNLRVIAIIELDDRTIIRSGFSRGRSRARLKYPPCLNMRVPGRAPRAHPPGRLS
jgi:hypothetical protein